MEGTFLSGRGTNASTRHPCLANPFMMPKVWVRQAFGTSSSTKEK
jgi:hypothetical protein